MASTNRGCKAITQGGGCRSALLKDGITRAPCLRMPDAMAAAALKRWTDTPENFESIKAAFQTTTNFGEVGSFDSCLFDSKRNETCCALCLQTTNKNNCSKCVWICPRSALDSPVDFEKFGSSCHFREVLKCPWLIDNTCYVSCSGDVFHYPRGLL